MYPKMMDTNKESTGTQTVKLNLEHSIMFQRQTLRFLRSLTQLKRPCTSLRIGGLKCLPEKERIELLSQFETIALVRAIQLKEEEVADLQREFDDVPQSEWHLYNPPNEQVLAFHQAKLDKKFRWLNHLSKTRFSHWPEKPRQEKKKGKKGKRDLTSDMKAIRNKKKREKKKRKRMDARARMVKEEGMVINLIDSDKLHIPNEAFAVLSYDAGFVHPPTFNKLQYRLDGFNARNRLENYGNCQAAKLQSVVEEGEDVLEPPLEEPVNGIRFVFPKELAKCDVYPQQDNNHNDVALKQVLADMGSFVDNVRPKAIPSNLSSLERKGLRWLRKNTSEGNLCVCKADKGGAIILVEPRVVSGMIAEKVQDESKFECLGTTNPLPGYKSELLMHWVEGVQKGFIPLSMAARTVGITKSMVNSATGKPSTRDIFKPGTPGFSVLPKIHKLTVEDLVPGVVLPFRMITDLSRGPTSRADKFISVNFLKGLQADYCSDLLQDTTMFLQRLEWVEGRLGMENNDYCFTMDFEQLYDSLSRDLVYQSLREAITLHRPEWEDDLVEWLLGSVRLSLESAVGRFGDKWYKAKDGVATGGKLCVYIANIAVYFALKRSLLYVNNFSCNLLYMFRFIDDCTGGWRGDLQKFYVWFVRLYRYLFSHFNLRITFNVRPVYEFLEFLDVRYRFVDGVLDTDIYYKPTDAHRYLNFNSHHPPHVFRSTVFSQFLRLRRIIIDPELLYFRLCEMKKFFIRSDYPDSMLNDTLGFVMSIFRSLEYGKKGESSPFEVPWVVTFGPGFPELQSYVKKTNKILTKSRLFKDCDKPVLGVVSRRAPNLKDTLFSQKNVCSESTESKITTRCRPLGVKKAGRKCMGCDLMSGNDHIRVGDKTVKCSGGNCTSNNLVYGAQCNHCNASYVGKTVQALRNRISQHRSKIEKLGTSNLEINDENSLAAHLKQEHNLTTPDDFNRSYKFTILKCVSDPGKLLFEEQKLINKLGTLRPYGLNFANPVNVGVNHLDFDS